MNARLVAPLLLALALASATSAQDWPQHLGPNRDGVYPGTLPGLSVEPLWEKEVGHGFAAPVVVGKRLILFHRVANEERVEALDVDTGEPVWAHAYGTAYRDDFGFDEGPRATPVVVGGKVFTHGAQGMLHALDLESGEPIWSTETRERFSVRKGWFGVASAPLVQGGKVLVNVGGRGGEGIVAFDADTGELAWTATNEEASYSAPTPFGDDAAFFTREGLTIVDVESGEVLHHRRWRSRSQASVNAAAPVVSGDIVFVTASYGTGALASRVTDSGLSELWSSDESMSSHYATPVVKDGVLYGFHGRQEYGPALRAVSLETGEVHWSLDRFMAGTVTLADGHLLVVRESGELVIAKADPKGFEPITETRLLPKTIRSYPAVADGRLYVRNERTLAAFRLVR